MIITLDLLKMALDSRSNCLSPAEKFDLEGLTDCERMLSGSPSSGSELWKSVDEGGVPRG